jgi:hypothetical protein
LSLQLAVEGEVGVGVFIERVDVFEGVDDGFVVVGFGVVGDYEVVWVAA